LIERFDSARLRMRPTVVDDAEALHQAYSDAALMTYWSSAPKATLDETRAYLERGPTAGDWRGWTMIRQADDAIIGTLAANEYRPGVIEIGYLVIRRHWGEGYAREGVSRLIDIAFDQGARRVCADTDPDNEGSNGLLKRLGFTCEGRLRDEWETHIGVRDSFIWGLLRTEWPTNRST
jgi:RimJ/RimL family protein N-acetyltransferase